MRLHPRKRPGYALLLVLAFILLFLSLLGIAYRQTAANLRVESARTQRANRDEGSIHALARAVTLLETGQPPHSPYVCTVTISTTSGPRSYTVTFTTTGTAAWSIRVAPSAGEPCPPMPTIFLP